MTDNIDFSRFAGRVAFPRSSGDLLSTTTCPACFTELTSTVCSACSLDLSNPIAAELYSASLATSAALDKRLSLIGRIRYDTARAAEVAAAASAAKALAAQKLAAEELGAKTLAAAAASAVPAPAIPAPTEATTPATEIDAHATAATSSPPLVTPTVTSASRVTPPVTAPPTPPASASPSAPLVDSPRKHSSIQVTLLVVGVSLLSIAAIFFLVYAFINFGIIWRSVIIAAITVGAIVAASLLRRRKLTATAEGIAVFGVVLVYLDVFAMRANDFFGLAAADELVYWGTGIVATSAVFMVWHRFSALRTPSIVGFSAFAPGVGVLVAGLVQNGDVGTRSFFTAATIAGASLLHRWLLPSAASAQPGSNKNVERIIILCTTTLALISGFLITFTISPDSDWSGTIAVIALVAITAAHLWALAPAISTRPVRTFAYIFSGMTAVFAASAVSIAALRIGTNAFVTLAPAISAVIVALAFEIFAHRGTTTWRRFGLVGAWSAASVLVFALLVPLFVAAIWTLLLPSLGITNGWRLTLTDDATLPMEYPGWSVLSLAIVGALTAASWTILNVIRKRGPLLAWLGAGILLAVVTLPSIFWITLAGWLGIAVVAIALLSLPITRSTIPLAYRVVLVATAIASGIFGYLISWASHSAWWIASIVVVILLVIARRIVTTNVAKATLLAIATVIFLVGSFAAALHITHAAGGFGVTTLDTINGARFASIAAAVLLGVFAVPLGRMVTATDRRVMFWITGVTSAVMLPSVFAAIGQLNVAERTDLLLPEYATSLIGQLIFLAAVVAWISLPMRQTPTPERAAASIATAPAVYFAIVAITNVATLPEFVNTVAPIVAALVVAAAALTIATVKPSAAPRWALDTGVVLVALPSVVYAVFQGGEFAWFVLILAAVTVLFLAVSRDGLFASTSARKHLGWLAIALATAGLWWRLWSSQVEALEPYVLPLAGVLLAIALLIAWSEVRRARMNSNEREVRTGPPLSAAPLVALGGLLVAILPLSANAVTGSLTRAIVVGAVSTALLLVGSLVVVGRHQPERKTTGIRWQPWLDSAALAGALGVIVTTVGRATMSNLFEWTADVWLASGLLVMIVAGIGQSGGWRTDSGRLRTAASQALAIIPMTAVLAIEGFALDAPQLGTYRALGLIALFAAIAIVCFTVNRAPFGRTVGGVSTTYWVIASVATLVTFPNDLVPALAPIASALLAAAIALAVTLRRPEMPARRMLDQGVIAVALLTVLISIGQNAPNTWLVLLFAAVTVLLLAVDNDGLFSSNSNRRHLGWVSLALATGGLWWRLFGNNVNDLEPYVLPLAGALLVIALLLERAKTKKTSEREQTQARGKAAPVIALGGLLVAVLPLAVNAASGDQLRAIIIGGVSAGLMLAGSLVITTRAAQRWWDSAALAGGIGVLVLMIGRAIYLPVSDVSRDAWIVGGFLLLIAAAFGQAIARDNDTDRLRGTASQTLGLIAMTTVLVMEIPAFRESPIGDIRALGLVFLFSAVHIIAHLLQRAPLSKLVGWVAIAFAGIAALTGVLWNVIDIPEFVTVPIAVALLTTGAMYMRDVAAARSWLWLAPGLTLLLLPSLIETFRDQVLWRMVGLGVVGVAVIMIGVMRKLQASFVMGVVVVLVHGVATFLPQLRAAYEFVPWWLWLGIGGAALIAVAVRFEQRRRDLKTVVTKFAELR